MQSRALQLSMAPNDMGRLETRPHAASLMVKAWKYKVNLRLNRWAPWTGRRCVYVLQMSRRRPIDILEVSSFMFTTRYGLVFSSFTHRGKRGLFHRANWNANTYRWAMCDVVFALYDIIPDDDNKLSRLFATFLSVYMILNQRKFTEECLDALHEKLKIFHRQNPDSCYSSTDSSAISQMSTRCHLIFVHHHPDVH
jgi:hypothetical protein